MDEIKRIDRQLRFKGNKIDFYADTIQLPDGNTTEWDFILHKGASAVVPVMDDGRIVVVKQLREAVDKVMIEMPAGGREPGETPLECAIRELREETGYVAGRMEPLIELHTTPAFMNELIHIYAAFDLTMTHTQFDPDEYIDVAYMTVDELVEKILAMEITNGITIGAVFAYKQKYLSNGGK